MPPPQMLLDVGDSLQVVFAEALEVPDKIKLDKRACKAWPISAASRSRTVIVDVVVIGGGVFALALGPWSGFFATRALLVYNVPALLTTTMLLASMGG